METKSSRSIREEGGADSGEPRNDGVGAGAGQEKQSGRKGTKGKKGHQVGTGEERGSPHDGRGKQSTRAAQRRERELKLRKQSG